MKSNTRILVLILTASLVFSLFGCSAENTTPDSTGAAEGNTAEQKKEAVELSFWSWNEVIYNDIFKAYMDNNPNVTIRMVPVQYNEYLQKLQIAVTSGSKLPDIGYFGSYFRGKAFALDVWENLEEEPYQLDRSKLVDYSISSMVNPKGEIVGVAESLSPGAMTFKRDLAKKYLGTDDSEEIQAMFPTWDDMINKGSKIVADSAEEVFLFSSLNQVLTLLIGQNAVEFINENTIDVTLRFKPVIDTMVKIRDAGIVDQLEPGSPAESAAMAQDNHIFWYCANWSRDYQLRPNDPDGEGNWALMMPPMGPVDDGGSALSISKTCEDKEAAWDVLKWYMSKDGATLLKDKLGMIPNLKEYSNDEDFVSYEDDFFGGQDSGSFFYFDCIKQINTIQISEYDMVVNDAMNLIMNALVSDNSLTADQALRKMIFEVQEKLPEVLIK